MIELILMRHAQAEPAAIDSDDFARPLTAQGRAAASQAAKRLAGTTGISVDRLLYSPAKRTSETAAILARELALAAATLQAVPELYLATAAALHAAVSRHHAGAKCVLVVGHNPSLSEFGSQLSPDHAQEHLPTAGFWRVFFEVRSPLHPHSDHSTAQKQ